MLIHTGRVVRHERQAGAPDGEERWEDVVEAKIQAVREELLAAIRDQHNLSRAEAESSVQRWEAAFGVEDARAALARRAEPEYHRRLGAVLSTQFSALKEAAAAFMERGDAGIAALQQAGASEEFLHEVRRVGVSTVGMLNEMLALAPFARATMCGGTTFCAHPERLPRSGGIKVDPVLPEEGLGALGPTGKKMMFEIAALAALFLTARSYPEASVEEIVAQSRVLNSPVLSTSTAQSAEKLRGSFERSVSDIRWRRALVAAIARHEGPTG